MKILVNTKITWVFLLLVACQKPSKQTQAQNEHPNILFIIADDAGLDMSAYGSTWVKTPAFDRIAREGLLFQKAYTPNAKCAPSRAVLLTGRNPWQLEAAMNHNIYFPTQFKTYMEALAENGYTTGCTGKGYAPGKALEAQGNPRPLTGKAFDAFKTTPPTTGISANDYAANFDDFLSKRPQDKPWAFWLGFAEPHRDYEFGSGIRKGGKTLGMIPRVPAYYPDSATVRTDLLDYAFEIEYMDAQIGKVLQTLEQTGQLDNTLIVVTSDHGMPFPRVKGNQYEPANHVPLAILWKKGIQAAGRKINDFVSFADLAPTFLEVAGIEWQKSGMSPAVGRSLSSIFQSRQAGQVEKDRDFVLVGQERHDVGRPHDAGYPVRGIYEGNYLYLRNYEPSRWPACNPETGYLNCDGGPTKTLLLNLRRNGVDTTYWQMNFGFRPSEELYDIAKDPDCVRNLAQAPEYKAVAKRLSRRMIQELTKQDDWRMQGKGERYEQYPVVENLNFYERFMKGEKLPTGWVNESDYEK
ncbi:MAG: sulfatase [Cytophagales bacterium]|nr:sulfatase [Cytophagales bacterium]